MSKKKTDFDSINKLIGNFNKKQKKEIQEELERETAKAQVNADDFYNQSRIYYTNVTSSGAGFSTGYYDVTNSWWRGNQNQPVAEDYEDVTDD